MSVQPVPQLVGRRRSTHWPLQHATGLASSPTIPVGVPALLRQSTGLQVPQLVGDDEGGLQVPEQQVSVGGHGGLHDAPSMPASAASGSSAASAGAPVSGASGSSAESGSDTSTLASMPPCTPPSSAGTIPDRPHATSAKQAQKLRRRGMGHPTAACEGPQRGVDSSPGQGRRCNPSMLTSRAARAIAM
jgi:hypothetical protein